MTRRNKGYAFVDYPSIEEAAAAITACNGTVLHGRQLHVEFSNKGGGSDGKSSVRTVNLEALISIQNEK